MKPASTLLFLLAAATAFADTTSQTIAVLDLEPRGGLSAEEVLALSDRLRGELIATGRYTVVERGQMAEILQEQEFQQSEACSDAQCLVQAGQMLAVHKMVGGSIGKMGRAYSVNIKIIDVQTGKIERQVADDIKCSKEELVSFHIRNVARRVAGLVKERKPLTSRWYFWTPLGVALVGGGAAAVYVLLNSGNAADETKTRDVQLEVPLQ